MNTKVIKTQITILGSGIVGLIMANLCAQNGFKVALIEGKEQNFLPTSNEFDIRCSAVSPSSERILRQIGIWEEISSQRVSPYHRMVVWDGSGFGEIVFDAKEVGMAHLGHIIENNIMQKALWDIAKSNSNIQFFCPYKPFSLHYSKEQAILEICREKDQHFLEIAADLIIGADGAHSWLREQCGFFTVRKDYQQHALVATVEHSVSHQKTAWQRFLSNGPIAFLPLADPNFSSVVWTETIENSLQYLKMEEPEFCDLISRALDYRLGKVKRVYQRSSFLLMKQYAKSYTQNQIALIGDAAHVIHPLAGQGLNLGILDAEALFHTLCYGQTHECHLGNAVLLKKYENSRKGHNLQMSMVMDFFNKIYGSENSMLLGLRGIGLNLADKYTFLKRKIIQSVI